MILTILYLVYSDLWRLLLDEYIDVWDLPRNVISSFQSITAPAKALFQPYVYRHANLRSTHDAFLFFNILTSVPELKAVVVSLHLAFIPKGSSLYLLKEHLPQLAALTFLSFAYSNVDADPLGTLVNDLLLRDMLPAGVHTLHLRSSCHDPSPSHPWLSALWGSHIASIPSSITTFILTTPEYIIWPPTTSQLESTVSEWTGALSSNGGSRLRRIFINSGFGDAGERTRAYCADIYWKAMDAPDADFSLKGMAPMEGSMGTRMFWTSPECHSWVTSPYLGMEYERELRQLTEAFGFRNENWKKGWAHLNPHPSHLIAPHVDRPDHRLAAQ